MQVSNQKIGFLTVTALVIGGMVGSGVFLLPSALANFGKYGLISWIVTGLGAIFLALTFAGLVARVPKTGGPHAFVTEAFGELMGFMSAIGYWVASWSSVPGIAICVVSNLSFIKLTDDPEYNKLFLEILTMAAILWINLLGVLIAGSVEAFLTVMKIIPLVILPCLALPFVDLHTNIVDLDLVHGDYSASQMISQAVIISIWGYLGVESATTPAGSIENPTKTIPKALITGTVVTTIIYILGTYVVMGAINYQELSHSSSPYSMLASLVFGEGFETIVSIMIALVCLGTLQATVLTSSQVSYGASLDGIFPKFFSHTNSKHAPVWSIVLPIVLIIFLFVVMLHVNIMEQFHLIVEAATVGFITIYFICSLALIKLVIREQHSLGRIFYSIVGMFSAAFSLYILLHLSLFFIMGFLLFMLLTIPAYSFKKGKWFNTIRHF